MEDVWNSEFYKTEFLENREKLRSGRFELIKLGRLCSKITKGATPNYESQGILFVKSENILQNELDVESTDFISKKVHEQMQRSQLKKNDVLFNIVGASIGRSCVFNIDIDANINQAVCLIRLNSPNYLPEWLSIILNSNSYQIWINQLKSGGARDNIDLSQVNNFEIPKHSLDIQNMIISINSQAYETKRQKEAEAKELLESIDAYLLEKLGIILPEKIEPKPTFFTRFKNLQGKRFDPFYHKIYFQRLINAINKSKYKVYKLGDEIKEINYGASFSNEYVENGVPLLRIKDLRRNEIVIDKIVYLPESARNLLGNSFVKTNDFLISRSGTIGVVSIVPKNIDGFAFGSFMIKFNLKENSLLDRNFLSYYLNCKLLIELIEREKIGAVQGNITIPIIKSILVPIPPLPIQKEIADHITNIRQQAKTLQNEAKTALEEAKRTVEAMILGE